MFLFDKFSTPVTCGNMHMNSCVLVSFPGFFFSALYTYHRSKVLIWQRLGQINSVINFFISSACSSIMHGWINGVLTMCHFAGLWKFSLVSFVRFHFLLGVSFCLFLCPEGRFTVREDACHFDVCLSCHGIQYIYTCMQVIPKEKKQEQVCGNSSFMPSLLQ